MSKSITIYNPPNPELSVLRARIQTLEARFSGLEDRVIELETGNFFIKLIDYFKKITLNIS